MTSTTDHDEVPSLNLVALLPSLIWLLGALVHLRIRSARGRTGVLVLSVLLGTAAWWSPVFQGMTDSLAAALVVSSILVTIWAVLVGLVLIPMVIGVFQYNRRVRGEPAS
jgi:hypothetical protein